MRKKELSVKRRLEDKLRAAFAPVSLVVRDDSALHHGHREAPAGGESHFHVVVVSDAFRSLSRVARHRLVYEAAAEELAGSVHALSVVARAPGEAEEGR